MCRGCGAICSSPPTELAPLEMQCVFCDGTSKIGDSPCKHCKDGYVEITQCPRLEMGAAFSREMRLVTHAVQDQLLPDAGGINDQSARFVHLWQAFRGDVALIEREEAKRG